MGDRSVASQIERLSYESAVPPPDMCLGIVKYVDYVRIGASDYGTAVVHMALDEEEAALIELPHLLRQPLEARVFFP